MTRLRNTAFAGSPMADVDVDAPTFNRTIQNAIADSAKTWDALRGFEQVITSAAGAVMTIPSTTRWLDGMPVEVVDVSGSVIHEATILSHTATTVTLSSAPGFVVSGGNDILRAADTITHNGDDGRGALLGIPYVNQYVGKTIYIEGSGTSKDAGGVATYLFACPLFVPAGEDTIQIDILADQNFGRPGLKAVAYLRKPSDFSVIGDDRVAFSMTEIDDNLSGNGLCHYRATITGITPQLLLFFVEIDTTFFSVYEQGFEFYSISVNPGRIRNRFVAATPTRSTTSDTPVTTPSSTQAVATTDFDDDLIDDTNDSLNGYLTTFLNRMLHGLWEFLTGWPAGGNGAYTHVDHDGAGVADDVDPARSRFFAHTRTLETSEPECDFPLYAEGFGAFKVEGGLVVDAPAIGSSPTTGMIEWFAPWPTDEAQQTIRNFLVNKPDFPTSPSRLKWAVLCGTDQAWGGANPASLWSVTAGETGSLPASVALAAVTNAPTGAGNEKLALAQGSGIGFTADAATLFLVRTERTSGSQSAVDEVVVLGCCFWFEPIQ